MTVAVVRSADGGLTFLANGVAYPLPRDEAVDVVKELAASNPELAAQLEALLADEASA